MALALMQQQLNAPVYPSLSVFNTKADVSWSKDFQTPGLSSFYEDNQRYRANVSLLPRVMPQEDLIEQDAYKGFIPAEWGEIAVSYSKENFPFLYNFKFICLERNGYNQFYPQPYLAVCFELELEGMGASKEAAQKDLYELLDIYFNETRKIHKEPGACAETINTQITRKNAWKESFTHAYKRMQKYVEINKDYEYQITAEE